MMSAIELVVPCTKRKQVDVPSHLMFRSLSRLPARRLAKLWGARVEAAPNQRPVIEMYSGAGWTGVLRAREAARALGKVRLHVLSAGLGLRAEDELVPAYSATFAADPDQVAKQLEGSTNQVIRHQEWWGAIHEWRGLGETPLAAQLSAAERILVAVGSDYLAAVHQDLRVLAETVGPERLFVISAGAQPATTTASLRRCLLPVDVEMQLVSGGTRSALNAWTAQWVLERARVVGWDRQRIELEIATAIQARKAAGARLPGVGRAHTDDEVKEWIRTRLAREPNSAGLLAKFRSEGRACLDTRFRRLADEVRHEQEKRLFA